MNSPCALAVRRFVPSLLLLLCACSPGGSSGGSNTGGGSSGGGGDDPPPDCHAPPPPTFTVDLPKLDLPPDEEGQGWTRPPVWEHLPDATDDSITIPNGRPIYALIVSGYASNRFFDELMVYRFARHLMSQGAYVHYAWWNNLLAPYMERPLHHPQSFPGDLIGNALDFASVDDASQKAAPGEDYQFVADAKRFLTAIREHNPSAMIVVVGHSMGGGAVVHLGSQTDVLVDLLAPIDPVGNRNYPFSGPLSLHGGSFVTQDYNWTRWRVSRDRFLGYKTLVRDGIDCVPDGPWLKDVDETQNVPFCSLLYYYNDAPTLTFGSHIVNLFHRYQQEALFPFDYDAAYPFGHVEPPGGSTSQQAVTTIPAFCGLQRCSDPGGWPEFALTIFGCCATGDGVGWSNDGHGEIVGYRGPLPLPVPLGVRVGTSPQCGSCDGLIWPARSVSGGVWNDGDSALRRSLLQDLETLPIGTQWAHQPVNPDLCLVSGGLIDRFDAMNRPPHAVAGGDQTLECTGQEGTQVVLDGTGSSDPESDPLDYTWTWSTGTATGPVATVTLPRGVFCITLTVRDPTGHVAEDVTSVTIQDTTPPDLTLALSPSILWPPNHQMVDIQATVEAQDLCGSVAHLTLVSITSSDADDGHGDGHTTGDIQGDEPGTLDTSFQLRAERSGNAGIRTYTVTYEATDDAGNRREVSGEVVVRNPNH